MFIKVIKATGKALAGIFLLAILLLVASGVSPIYDFRPPRPFSGPDIFNPYRGLTVAAAPDSASASGSVAASASASVSACVPAWKRAVFHTHTRVKGPWPVNECPYWPEHVDSVYRTLGYDIVTFSNHNELTVHPYDTALQVNVYEHGYNLFKYHKCVFGAPTVIHFDNLLPVLASQKQFLLDYLGRTSDLIQMNHPFRTVGTSPDHMRKLSGYEIMELDSGVSTENEYWDWALSAGHYSFALANDDLHYPDRTDLTGVRCNFLDCPSGRYEDIRKTLLEGGYYSMRVPDYGGGDWAEKQERNRHLPFITGIGLRDSTVFMTLSVPADSIRAIGQDHSCLALAVATDSLSYTLPSDEPYVRLCAWFPDGEVIYTNPFARYDASVSDSPFDKAPQKVNVLLTILYNLAVLLFSAGLVYLLVKLIRQ